MREQVFLYHNIIGDHLSNELELNVHFEVCAETLRNLKRLLKCFSVQFGICIRSKVHMRGGGI